MQTILIRAIHIDFNPHHHAGGDGIATAVYAANTISIHTTTQVVTGQPCNKMVHKGISIHTTTQVVTVSWALF